MGNWDALHRAGATVHHLDDLPDIGANGREHKKPAPGLVIVRAADVKPKSVEWIWKDRLACGKLTLLAGLPDVGKSQISADATARITKGRHWPNGERAPLGDVVILASEDSIEDTWVPRLMAAGADLARVHFIKMVIGNDGKRRTFSLQQDIEALADKIKELRTVQLAIIDPITSYLGKVDLSRLPMSVPSWSR